MCGIIGFSGKGDRSTAEAMTESLKHRGPDDQGIFNDEATWLGQTRLSIIDTTEAGHQPISSPDGNLTLIFNGEIYNHEALRSQFKNYQFKGKSDSEVLLALYDKYGHGMCKHLNGMFALAIYDKRKKSIFLARDRFGKKPLFYTTQNNNLYFASELKALKQHPDIRFELDSVSLQQYLIFEYVPEPRTIWKDISKLPAGHSGVWDGHTLTVSQYWTLNTHTSDISFEDATSELDRHLDRSVSMRLMSDVPLGVFLSGGIDSSTVAYYAQKHSTTPVQTFSIGFSEESFNESSHAEAVAKKLSTDHTTTTLSAREAIDIIPRLPDISDEPMADSSLVPTYLLSRETRKHVTVALGGDGADELFYGYPTFYAHTLAEKIERLPKFLVMPLLKAARLVLPRNTSYMNVSFLVNQFLKGLYYESPRRNQRWIGSFLSNEVSSYVLDKDSCHIGTPTNYRTADSESSLHALSRQYLKTYLLDDILVKVDRASMANSLEVRAPFLDYELAQFVLSLPDSYKLRRNTGKHILKELMRDRLPEGIVDRKKHGFALPLTKWLRSDLRPLMTELLSAETLKKQGIFQPASVERLVSDHLSRKADNRKQLWTLIMFQLWYNRWNN